MVLVYRYRVKSLTGLLNQQARTVSFVWNYCNDRQKDALRFGRPWLTGFDLNNLTTGSSKELGLHSGVINAVCEQFAKSRAQHRRPYLRYRSRKSLGWVPMKGRDLHREGNAFRFAGNTFRVFYSRPLPEGKIRDGSCFAQDRRGNWFLNIVIEVAEPPIRPLGQGVGIDLGLKDFAVLSNKERIDAPGFYRKAEAALAVAQRAHKRRRVKAIHARTARQRLDFLNKRSVELVRAFDHIAVGSINAGGLAQTGLAKSVLDAGWSTFRKMLAYKAIRHGVRYVEVSERFTTQTCSTCGALPDSRPKGIAGLGIREWTCSDCETVHDRDVNAAINILRRGRATLEAGISVL
ncbi:RNA-guided endonuclease InsQ/TnpB family protein [Massilia endophytica]|uniref:RNA-guided endonuclease InsQ/TnpB family protein n=1 Tax=Massilia endophytica TaxID=2899220 RepID=UPI001E375891|nr:transposase [Massilia endophytica]UGQ47154.1 transposase [Massilia endophytica]